STRYAAEIVKMDEALDLALLKVSPKAPLTAAVLGDSDVVRVADEVIAIGTPFGLDMTVSRGIVSAKRKSLVIEGVTHSNLLQTDAAINQGNSGGPLVGTSGAVIGINTAIYTPNGAFAGIGFAVPSNQARLFVLDEVGWLPSSTMEGAQFGLVALPSQGLGGVGSAGPAIIAGTPAPHADGRQNMDCTTCHDVIRGNGPVAQRPANRAVMPVAAVGVPPPPIAMGTVSPHTDGRQAMSCATCHQMLPAAGAAATVAAPGAGAYGFAQAPGSLAINIQAVRNQPAAAAGRVSLMGAAMTEMSASLSQQTGQPVGRGVYLAGVTPGSPMAAAGLRPGDILLKVDGRPVRAPQEASAILSGIPDGRTVRLGILRDGDVRAVDLVAGPAGLAAAAPMPAAPPMSPMPPITGGITGTQRPAAGPVGPAAVAKPPTEFNWLGMEIETFQAAKAAQTGVAGAVPTAAGAQVAEIVPGSRAANAGLLANDVIMEVNNRPVAGPARLDAAIKAAEAAGQQILMKIHRSGQEFYVVL
ncbi:MAG TPA: magnetochrome domain-containing protein, partial [Rhodospirillaceae bacterium]|nr:magnetochrome domain-containing protein [Rhodospirillaceae bacterium]